MSQQLPFLPSNQRGFTLIEMLVAVSIMLVIVGGGMAAFSRFNDRVVVTESARSVQSFLRTAQTKARAGDRPNVVCAKLEGYRVTFVQNLGTVTMTPLCRTPATAPAAAPLPAPNIDTLTLPGNVVSDVSATLDFLVLKGGVLINNNVGTGTVRITLKNPGIVDTIASRYSFVVSRSGEIREGGQCSTAASCQNL